MKSLRTYRLAVVLVTIVSFWLTTFHLRLSSDLTDLFPSAGEAAMLTRFLRGFGGGDLAVVLVRGTDPAEVQAATADCAAALRGKPSVVRVLEGAPPPRAFDPTLAWAYAAPSARARLADALTPAGMRARLDGTREILLAPGSSGVEEWLARDPLRLVMIPWEAKTELAAGLHPGPDGAFVADEGRARLVVAEPRGSAFVGDDAEQFVSDAQAAMSVARAAHPSVRLAVTGGHAIAAATADMLRWDMIVSATLSTVLASLMFLVTFRRMRALAAVLPPLGLGTLWTTGIAALFPGGLSAIATAFAAVVIGVGVDTGVHVYAALLDARRAGMTPAQSAIEARRRTARPTLLAALAAGLAFASLLVSDLHAVRQLGVLCGAGEVLTAIGILVVTPEIGAWLERGAPPPRQSVRWAGWLARLTGTRRRAIVALAVVCVPALVIVFRGWPTAGDQLVAIRPQRLAPLVTQHEIYEVFGSKEGQWLVVSADPVAERAMERADAVAEALDTLVTAGDVEGFDALANFAPTQATQRMRFAARDALDLPSRAETLSDALVERGFDKEACATGIESLRHPARDTVPIDAKGPLAWVLSRHVARDGPDTLAVSYVRPSGDPVRDARAIERIHAADPKAVITGYHHLETALKKQLAHDLPIVALVAIALVVLTLRAVLKRASDVVLALATIAVEVVAVAAMMRIFGVRWHVYDALVLPVLIGITMDESMFLLYAARSHPGDDLDVAIERALTEQGPLVVSTALTTAVGFGALVVCRFDGLVDLGAVGALGSVLGLIASLVVAPAGLRLFAPTAKRAPRPSEGET